MTPQQRLSDSLYQRLRDQIITLDLAPGKPLAEKELMRELGTGRTPLRDALQRLAGEGLVVVVPRQGTFVASVNVADLRSIMEIRLLLEPYAAQLCAQRATAGDLAAMRRVLDETDEPGDRQRQYKLDLAFHHAVNTAARNKHMAVFLESLQVQSIRFFRHLQAARQSLDEIRQEHYQIVEALERRDAEAAAALMRRHVEESRSRLLAALSGDTF